MPKIMLIDTAQPEETRVAVMDGNRLENFDIESVSKKQLKGNIYLAKVTRVEPSLQAAFVNYGGNRHGFLPFSEIHPDYYRIPVEDRQRLMAEQEELRRQIQEEAEARELAEAEAAESGVAVTQAATDEAEGDISDAAADEIIAHAQNTPLAEEEAEDEDETSETEDEDDSEDESDDVEDDAEGEEITAEGDEEKEDAEGTPIAAEGEEGEKSEDGAPRRDGRSTRGGRGRGRGGRNSGGRGGAKGGRRGLERGKSEQVTDREPEEDPLSMSSLWKRMRRSYKIQEVIKRGQIMLIQVVKEERGNKGAAVTSYITMPGRYCVLMPNSPQSGGVSRKVASHAERRKMREMLDELQVPEGMSVILRTAGVDRTKVEVKRDLDYLMRLWDSVRDTTMQSTAPSLIHEEGSLVKRAIRDLYSNEIEEIVVEGDDGMKVAKDVMKMMMPSHVRRVRQYKDAIPLFTKYNAEPQIDAIHSSTVTLKSGGYLVINPTEALISIDINSGRATRERHIEDTAVKTNLEAAEEIARQLRLRDLGGLVVIDFIDMENRRNNAAVEKRMRDALSGDRARVQVGRISTFGLLELSRQRLRPSLTETHFQTCPHCHGSGTMRTTEALALAVLRAIESAGMEGRAGEVEITVPEAVALFLFNVKRKSLAMVEQRYDLTVVVKIVPMIEDDQGFHLEATKSRRAVDVTAAGAVVDPDLEDEDGEYSEEEENIDASAETDEDDSSEQPQSNESELLDRATRRDGGRGPRGPRPEGRTGDGEGRRRGRRGGRNRTRGSGEGRDGNRPANLDVDGNIIPSDAPDDIDDNIGNRISNDGGSEADGNGQPRAPRAPREGAREGGRERGERGGRNRGRRGGRGRNGGSNGERSPNGNTDGNTAPAEPYSAEHPAPAPAARPAPRSAERRPAAERTPERSSESEAPRQRDYEVVNEVTGERKKGWWKKLTG